MNATITLLIYWSIAIGLIGGGLFALAKGFQLVREGKGKTKEESSVEFLGIKASVGSIGALVMITAFMWGWAAKLALPSYKDAEVEIHALRQQLNEAKTALASAEQNSVKPAQVRDLENRLASATSALAQINTRAAIVMAKDNREEKQRKLKELEALIAAQRSSFGELQKAVKNNDRAAIDKTSKKLEETTTAIEKATKDQ